MKATTNAQHADVAEKLAASADYIRENPTNPEVESIKESLQVLVHRVDFSELSPEDWRLAAATHFAMQLPEHESPKLSMK